MACLNINYNFILITGWLYDASKSRFGGLSLLDYMSKIKVCFNKLMESSNLYVGQSLAVRLDNEWRAG